jgi:HlyD family secretion protein
MQIADLSHMVVKANINEVNIPRVSVNQEVGIRLDALPGQSFQGTVTEIATQGVKTENIVTYEVTIAIDTPHKILKPMLTANIDIVTNQLENVLTIPLEALRVENGDDVVEVLIDESPQVRKVRVALRTETQAVITRGIQEHDQVIIPSFKADEAPH